MLTSGVGKDGTRTTLSPGIARRSRLDARIDRRGQVADQRLGDAGDLGDDVLAIVDDQQEMLALERRRQGSIAVAGPPKLTPRTSATMAVTS